MRFRRSSCCVSKQCHGAQAAAEAKSLPSAKRSAAASGAGSCTALHEGCGVPVRLSIRAARAAAQAGAPILSMEKGILPVEEPTVLHRAKA
eukprot:CAMPEP_0195066380 /NCGR_PEP_ID=MMETSP0448-20130528/11748_1 /TAXON_ID=66468 /ORGANISM="Heterocapsa triquestra, Strain CCMP 448" /LENGTH=90 /DNA_ID=CAMNT_0040097623 /DNA_START=116 /DNA_END=383 /DNA_ORIENTATION=+